MRRIAVLMAVVLLAGCGTTEPSLSESLVGTWTTNAGGVYVVFKADATYGVGHSPELAAPADPTTTELEWGTWSTDGSALTMVPHTTSEVCPEVPGTYEVDVADDSTRLEVAAVEDDCPVRLEDFGSGLTRQDETTS